LDKTFTLNLKKKIMRIQIEAYSAKNKTWCL